MQFAFKSDFVGVDMKRALSKFVLSGWIAVLTLTCLWITLVNINTLAV